VHYLHLCMDDCNGLHLEGTRQSIREFINFRTDHPERMIAGLPFKISVTRLVGTLSCRASSAALIPNSFSFLCQMLTTMNYARRHIILSLRVVDKGDQSASLLACLIV